MKISFPYPICYFLTASMLIISCQTKKTEDTVAKENSSIVLEELSPEQTGIQFQNTIDEKGRINIFTWHALYNGGGVGVADFNGDDLPDLYFSGTMVPDKIYLNKGNFQFEDITESSGIDNSVFSTGVSIVDINYDGKPDIYVCKSSPTGIAENNRNRLYINQGNAKFKEESQQYGLGDIGFSVQATFFDVDQDGDLDAYILNQPFDEFARLVNKPEVVSAYTETDRLYINENNFFRDRTAEFGLEEKRYGLSTTLSDFDLNGWPDLYICNDYFHPDRLLMNFNGKLVDELDKRTGHISFYSMGSDAGDVNNDGKPDLITLDMAFEDHVRSKTNMGSMNIDRFWQLVKDGNHYQYMQNALQVNTGNGNFSDVAQLSGISKTDWSYAALFADLNADGWSDLLVTNGVLRDLQNNDFNMMVKNKFQGAVGPSNFLEVLDALPSVPVPNLIFQNDGDLKFHKAGEEVGFSKPGFSHGMAYSDLDGDGDLDIVVNNMNAPASVYKNNSVKTGNHLFIQLKGEPKNTNGIGASVLVYYKDETQIKTVATSRGYLSSVEPILHFGIGETDQLDSVVVIWNHKAKSILTNVKINEKLLIDFSKTQKVPYTPVQSSNTDWNVLVETPVSHVETDFNDFSEQVLLPYKLSQDGPNVTVHDVNGDGLDDFFMSGGAGQSGSIFIQQTTGQFTRSNQPDLIKDRNAEDRKGLFFDADGDNDADLLVVSGSNEMKEGSAGTKVRLYINTNGNFQRASNTLFPDVNMNGSTAVAFDLEGDGDQDLFLGGRLVSGKYMTSPKSYILKNENGKFSDVTESVLPAIKSLGMITDAKLVGDEIWIVGEWMYPHIVEIKENGKLNLVAVEEAGVGLWWTVSAIDADNDGDQDMLLGNLGLNNKFGGSKGTPLEVYAGDLDANGDYDVVLAVEKKNKTLPVRGRECSSQEMPFILDKFPSYESYANADLKEIYTPASLEGSIHNKLTIFASSLMINENGNWKLQKLPTLCQTGPVKSFAVGDFNADGNVDFIYTGNHYPAEVETARYDGLFTGIAFNDGKGNFHPSTIHSLRRGDYRDIQAIHDAQGNLRFLLAENNGPLQILIPPYLKLEN